MVNWKEKCDFAGCTYWVFDDFPAERLKASYKQIMGGQKEFEITDKYLQKKTIRNFGPAIYLMNTPEFNQLNLHLDMEWVYANVWVINVTDKLY